MAPFLRSLRLTVGCLCCALAVDISAQCRPQSKPLFVSYETSQTVASDKETRSIQTTFLLNDNGLLQYSHDDYALGSLNETTEDYAESYNVFTRDPIIFRPRELNKLAAGLKKIRKLKSGPEPIDNQIYPPAYLLSLNFRNDNKEKSVSYWSERDAALAKPVVDVVLQFLTETLSAVTIKKTIRITQGDGVAPIPISIPELLRQPDIYNGKRVKVSGRYELKLENSSLSDTTEESASLWISTLPSSYSKNVSFEQHVGHLVSIEGVFIAGSGGHLGMWKGEIKRVTQLQLLVATSD
jgi:hypothetical protein